MVNKATIIIISALSIVLIVSLSVNAAQYLQNHPIRLFPYPRSTPIIENQVLINGTITVNSNYAYFIEFSLPNGPYTHVLAYVLGNFTVSKGDTIRVLITHQNGFYSPLYDSGVTISGTFNLTLRSGGTYFLYYINNGEAYNYSPTPEKIVTTDVTLWSEVID